MKHSCNVSPFHHSRVVSTAKTLGAIAIRQRTSHLLFELHCLLQLLHHECTSHIVASYHAVHQLVRSRPSKAFFFSRPFIHLTLTYPQVLSIYIILLLVFFSHYQTINFNNFLVHNNAPRQLAIFTYQNEGGIHVLTHGKLNFLE